MACSHDDLGDLREIVADPHQRNPSGEIGHGHAEDRGTLKLPQPFDLPLRLVLGEVFEPRRHFFLEHGARRRQPAGRLVQQLVEQQRMRRDLRGQEFAERGHFDQLATHECVLVQECEIRGARADGLEHLEHAPQHGDLVRLEVGLSRRPQVGY
jgi:hypothetical protein